MYTYVITEKFLKDVNVLFCFSPERTSCNYQKATFALSCSENSINLFSIKFEDKRLATSCMWSKKLPHRYCTILIAIVSKESHHSYSFLLCRIWPGSFEKYRTRGACTVQLGLLLQQFFMPYELQNLISLWSAAGPVGWSPISLRSQYVYSARKCQAVRGKIIGFTKEFISDLAFNKKETKKALRIMVKHTGKIVIIAK